MKRRAAANLPLYALIWCTAITLAFPQLEFAQQADKREILKKARGSYYSLKNEGFDGFKCDLTPNWEVLLADLRKSDPKAADSAVRLLSGLRFSLGVRSDGTPAITHNTIPADNDQMAKGLSQIYSGLDQMMGGFFQTWSAFLLVPPLPEPDGEYLLENEGSQYRLAYKEGATDVASQMSKEFEVNWLRVTTKEFDSTLWPRFTKTPKGFLLAGYRAAYQGTSGADKTDLLVEIDNQEVSGLWLPHRVHLKGAYGGTPFETEVLFEGCSASKR